MPIIKTDAQGIIKTSSSIARPGSDGVVRQATSAWASDKSGVIRRVYGGGSQPSTRDYIFKSGIWSDTLLTVHTHEGDYTESGGTINIVNDNTTGTTFAIFAKLILKESTTAQTSATFMRYTKLGIDLHSESEDGSYASLSLTDRIGIPSSGYGVSIDGGVFDNVVILNLSGVTAEECAGGVQYLLTATQGYVQRTTIRAIWLS
ncbi:hypothetical protein [Anaeromassilibacillus senegalensis]|uniref:hypothetical protein n=1 Tax=Anaeromassilibacillus senegalensis TaxID=1673717 RepID=UPI0012B52FBD|nr:hypothetical protein [Anaeromassilibacillus senegalensis]